MYQMGISTLLYCVEKYMTITISWISYISQVVFQVNVLITKEVFSLKLLHNLLPQCAWLEFIWVFKTFSTQKRECFFPLCILFLWGFKNRTTSSRTGIGCTRDHFKSEESEKSCILKEGCIWIMIQERKVDKMKRRKEKEVK